MISQADILKTLINKNCTDDTVMTTALAPNCTPPKLLEKLTEAERFDLALDISIKLGLDVIPLWRTWAMRCLKYRNFPAAREKFRHCFIRLRMPSRRNSPAYGQLLSKILSELIKMDEHKLTLSEEIQLIKQNIHSQGETSDINSFILLKPNIYSECLHYLDEYGEVEDKIRFNVRNSIWDVAVKLLLENCQQINLERFFIGEVFRFTASTGSHKKLLEAFTVADPKFSLSSRYFKSIYDFCLRHKRINLLYYVQTFIGDFVAAASTQINLFFLKVPVINYKELNQRITHLMKARKNYQDYLEENSRKSLEDNVEKTTAMTSIGKSSQLVSVMPRDKVEKQIKLIDLQIKITRNFALNEVSGCIPSADLTNNVKVNSEKESKGSVDDVPVTLFEESTKRKTFLTALVLIYFDLSCTTYFSRYGLDLAKQLIVDHDLDKLKVFKTAMRVILEDESCDILENASLLFDRIKEDLSVSKKDDVKAVCDEVILDSINSCREPDYKMELAKLLSCEARIELYIEHGKLSNAQRLAFNMSRADYVSRIIKEADRLNQDHVKTICQLWLAKHETRNLTR